MARRQKHRNDEFRRRTADPDLFNEQRAVPEPFTALSRLMTAMAGRTSEQKQHPTPSRPKACRDRSTPVVVAHERRGRRLSAEVVAGRRQRNRVARRSRRMNRRRGR